MAKTYDTFDHIEQDLLRTYNRTRMLMNIHEDAGEEQCDKYFYGFSEEDQFKIKTFLLIAGQVGIQGLEQQILKTVSEETSETLERTENGD